MKKQEKFKHEIDRLAAHVAVFEEKIKAGEITVQKLPNDGAVWAAYLHYNNLVNNKMYDDMFEQVCLSLPVTHEQRTWIQDENFIDDLTDTLGYVYNYAEGV
jgi:hypothetical protein